MISDDQLRVFVAGNPGQGSFEEYRYLRDVITRRSPCRLLVFGVGKDSGLWVDSNATGKTVFVEHEAEWIEQTRRQLPGVEIHRVTYGTKRSQWKKLLHRTEDLQMRDLPPEVGSAEWDVIFVDSPQGGNDKRPGRMKSIYTAAQLARRGTDLLVHDCDREVEQVYSDTYIGDRFLVAQVRTLRHYHID